MSWERRCFKKAISRELWRTLKSQRNLIRTSLTSTINLVGLILPLDAKQKVTANSKSPGNSRRKGEVKQIRKVQRGGLLPFRRVWLISPFVILLLVIPSHVISNQSNDLHFTDITEKAGITFKHVSSPEKKYIVESMSGGLALIDYDNDGYPDIYFVNSLTVDLVKSKGKTKSALYHNNGDGTFTDGTDKAGIADI